MLKDDYKTTVFFVKEEGNSIVAVFPYIKADSQGNCVCYAHLGQHSACCREWYMEQEMATPDEYADLKKELEDLGYNLKLVKRK